MSDTKHTPGEWKVKECTEGLIVTGRPQEGNRDWDYGGYGIVCTVNYEASQLTEEDRANAERIVLCHNCHDDLVAALKGCAQVLRESAKQFRSLEDHPGHAGIADNFAALAEAALAKAGEK